MTERAKHLLTYFLIAASGLVFMPLMAPPLSASASDISLYVTSLTGLVGIALLLWQYILGTRTVTGLFYRDLSWTLKLHTLIGKYAVPLIFLHPIASLLAYGENVLYIFVPDLRTGYEQTITWGRLGFLVLLFIWVTSALVRGKMAYRPWKYLHYASYVILPLTFLHSQSIGTTLLASKPAMAYWWGLVGIWGVITLLRLRFIFGFGKQAFRISESTALGPQVQRLKLTPLQKPLRVKNGQYLYLQTKLLSEEHPFSTYSFDESGTITVAFKRVGSFTQKLAALPTGSIILADGPYGAFTEEVAVDPQLPAVFISGGIGITPFYKTLVEGRPGNRQYHFDCNLKASGSLLGPAERQKLGDRYISVLSRDPLTVGPGVEHGYINSDIIRKYVARPQDFHYFICGPVPMMEHTRRILKAVGIPDRQIKMEKFTF